MAPSASRILTYLLLLIPPLVVSIYLLASFPTPPPRLPLPVLPGLASLPPDSRAREIYPVDSEWAGEGRYAQFPLGRTRYWLAGPESGKKIVLIHGLSVPALIWAPLVPQLAAAGHRVLLYDLYGRGYSDAPASAAYDTHLYLTQLALLLQRVGWARTRVMGVSMGGAIAAAFVTTFPHLVEDDIVLISSAGLLESADLSRTAKVMSSPLVQALTANRFVYAYLRRLADRAVPPSDVPEPLASQSPQGLGAQDPQEPLHLQSTQAPLRAHAPQELVRLQSAHLPGFNRAVSSSLRAGPVTGLRWAFESGGWAGKRVLVVHGADDHTVTPAHAPRLAALLGAPRACASEDDSAANSTETRAGAAVELALVPGAGHGLTWTHAHEVGALVCAFLG